MFYIKFLFVVLFVSLSAFSATYLGAQDSTQTITQRAKNGIFVTQMQPPYTWMDTVNLNTDTLYAVPDSIRVCEVRLLKPGTYNFKLSRSGYRSYVADTSDILRIDVRNFRKGSTDSLCRFRSIILFGFVK